MASTIVFKFLRDTLSSSLWEAFKLNSLEEDWDLIGKEKNELLVKGTI